jgi:flotillin
LIGAAEARAIEAVGRAEAEKMRMKASAYKQYGDAAVMALVLEALPQVKIATTTIQIRKRKFIICSR